MKNPNLVIQRFLILYFVFGFLNSAKGQWRTELHQIILYGGSVIIANPPPVLTLEASYEYFNSACSQDEYNGFAARLDYVNGEHYAWSARYFSQLIDMPTLALSPYWSIGGGQWKKNEKRSVFIRPAIGFRSSTFSWLYWQRNFPKSSLNLNVSYAYLYAFNKSENYIKSPHELSFMLGWAYHIRWFPINTRLFKSRSMKQDAKHWGR